MQFNFMNKHLKALAIFGLGLGAANSADAQISYPYVVDFEDFTKTGYASAVSVLNGGSWTSAETIQGNDSQNPSRDLRNGSKSLRMRPNSGNTFFLNEDLPLGIDTLSFVYARSNFSNDRTTVAPELQLSYSIDQGTTWVPFDTLSFDGIDQLTSYSHKLNISSPVRIKFNTVAGSDGRRFNIDDLRITAAAQATNINIIGKTPVGTVNPNTVNQLAFTFNEAVQLNSGNITLQEVGGAAQVFDVATATNVRASNDSVIVDGLTIAPLKQYYVLVDSTVALGVNSNLNSVGIYDVAAWTFSTTDTILNRFTENFDNCENGPLGVFVQQSLVGTSTWYCNTYNDSTNVTYDAPYVSINGGSGAVSFANEDLLITSLPIKFDALAANHSRNAILSYYEKRRFGGNGVTRGVFYSTDYAGDAATATWVAINDNLPAIGQTGSFFPASVNINSAANTNQPFFLAFKYTSISDTDTAVNWEWALDRISVNYTDTDTSTTSTNKLSADNIFADVLGNATTENIDLRLSVRKDMEVAIRMYDINGRLVYNTVSAAKAGTQRIQLKNTTSNAGMYIIRLTTADGEKSIKTLVH